MKIIAGKLIIVEQWCFQKQRYDNTQAVKTINTSPSEIFKHLTRESEMWFSKALQIVFDENVPEKVFEMSCSWFLGIIWPKIQFWKHAKSRPRSIALSYVLSWKFFVSTSKVSILVKVVVLIYFSLHMAGKRQFSFAGHGSQVTGHCFTDTESIPNRSL